jgi:hypothetical protein
MIIGFQLPAMFSRHWLPFSPLLPITAITYAAASRQPPLRWLIVSIY